MNDFPLIEITIYHKTETGYIRYNKLASYRSTSIQNRNRNGVQDTDKSLIRIFDLKDYNKKWFIEKGDIIVNKKIEDEILRNAPLSQLSKKYGRENVQEIISKDEFIFGEELDHVKLGAK